MSGLVDSSPPGGSIVRPMPPPGPYLDTNGQLVDPKTTPPPDGSYRNFTPPPNTPDKLAVSVTPGSKDQYAIGSGEQIAAVPVGGYGPEASGVYVPPGGTQAVDIQTGKPRAAGPANPIKDAVRDEWLAAGYPPAAVEGIMRRVNAESGWDVHNTGDKDPSGNPTSFGLYQHHADRAQKLAQYLENNKVDLKDPVALARAQTKFAISEMNGGDSIAAKHKGELQNPNISAQDAYGVFTSSFERPKGSPGSEETNLRSNALGPFNAGASAVLDRLMGDIDRQGKNYESAIAEGKDLRSVARAAMAKWELDSEHPPQDMRENWNQWAGAAIGLAMLGGFFGKNHTAAINAAGEMLQAANQADVRAYDIAYKRWKDHNDNGLKLIELLHGEARDVINDAKNSYDMTVTKLATLGTMYQLQQHLDPTSVENIEKNLRVSQLTTQIAEAQKKDADEQKIRAAKAEAIAAQEKQELDQHPEWKGVVPAWRHLEIVNEAEKLGKGQSYRPSAPHTISVEGPDGKIVKPPAAAYSPDGKNYFWVGTNEPVEVPPGGKINLLPQAAGNRVQPQLQRLLGAGSQMEAHLTNLSEMPIGGSVGAFMGIESKTPDELREGLVRTATRKLFTTDEIKAMQNEFIGVGRQIAALDSQGAAQGLVGLSKQAEGYAPLPDDSPVIVMRKYASLRQIVEQSMKGVLISGTANADQKAGAQEIISKVQAAIPYTVHDINQIQFGGQKGSTEAATEIINRRRQELAIAELIKRKDDPAAVESFKRHFPNLDVQGILNSGQ